MANGGMRLEKWQRKKIRHMRRIVVDGKPWRWCIMKVKVGFFSEYTPGIEEITLFVRSFGYPLETVRVDDVAEFTAAAIGPRQVADYIRRLMKN